MTIAAHALHPLFGAELSGCGDLARGAGSIDTDAIERELGRRGLLLFRNQDFDDDGLARFASRFGHLQNMSGRLDSKRVVVRVSNLAEDGSIRPADDGTRLQHEANRLWHADSTFLSPGASYSFLHARIVTSRGGETEFCDTRIGWEALGVNERAALDGLEADHCMLHSWRLAEVDASAVAGRRMSVIRRPLASLHRPSGRRALMVPSHVMRIEGLEDAAGRALLAHLAEVCTEPARTYAHAWRPGDLLVWDNRCMLHRVKPYEGLSTPRDLRSCRVADPLDDGRLIGEAY